MVSPRPEAALLSAEAGKDATSSYRIANFSLLGLPHGTFTACGCTLTRPIPALIAAAALQCVSLEELDLPLLGRASGHLFVGAARVRAG